MDLNLLGDDKVPLAISEDILRYLQYQGDHGGGEEGSSVSLTNFTEERIKEILEEILRRFEERECIKENYEARAACHNQRELLDFKAVIDDFEIDDEMYEALTFRENLMVSCLDEKGAEIPVGGMCLDIQKALGKQPSDRKACENIEIRLQRIFNKEHKEIVGINEPISGDIDGCDDLNDNCIGMEDGLGVQNDRGKTKFLIHVQSQFDYNGSNAGSCITSWVDREMHTIEELRREFCVLNKDGGEVSLMRSGSNSKKNDSSKKSDTNSKKSVSSDSSSKQPKLKVNEKDLYVGMVKNYYYVKHKSTLENLDDRKFYSFGKASKYIAEGTNFLLHRYLAIIRYIGVFELSAMYINGDMCRNIYDCTGPESELINDVKLDICKIERTIIEECGIEHKCYTTLTLQGQLIRQEWEGTPYFLQVNPMAKVSNQKPCGNEQILLKHNWEGDMQLFSNYLDEKVRAEMRIKSYMGDHPEFKGIIMDYINAILLLKPEDILDFTMNHFMSFSPTHMPKNDYFY
ncbi:ciliogenesis-associated TTC17-interacting protein [Onthophagus taurus]|uniref:ciliogenesis-associated TTC17-interacting protein n=1 Tax=Onthophagus taurus TaxID=166361 RepID=UPI0039BEA5F6